MGWQQGLELWDTEERAAGWELGCESQQQEKNSSLEVELNLKKWKWESRCLLFPHISHAQVCQQHHPCPVSSPAAHPLGMLPLYWGSQANRHRNRAEAHKMSLD